MIKEITEYNKKITSEILLKENAESLINSLLDKNGNLNIAYLKGQIPDKLYKAFEESFDENKFRKIVDEYKKENDDSNVDNNIFVKNIINESYGLNFLGKSLGKVLARQKSTTIFVPDEKNNSEVINKNSKNIYITADNLEALRHLKNSYSGRIKCIYIDPPYNTGSDGFCYPDDFYDDIETIKTKFGVDDNTANAILGMTSNKSNSHNAWLSFMYPRLLLAKELLCDEGCIFISIDNNELSNLKLLCDTVFGEENYIDTLCLKTKASSGASGGGEDKKLKKNHEYVLMCCKDKENFIFDKPKEKIEIEKFINDHKEEDIGFYYTRIIDNFGSAKEIGTVGDMKVYEHCNFVFSTVKEKMEQEKLSLKEVYAKYFDKIFMVTNAQTSRLGKINEYVNKKNSLISYEYISTTGKDKGILTKKYIWNETLVVWFRDSAVKDENNVYKLEEEGTLWNDISWGRLDVETQVPFKNGVKPIKLMQRLMNLIIKENDIVMDFFSGSGSTAHAVLDNNASLNKKNEFMMIQINENLDESYKRADSLTKKYIKRQIDFCDELKEEHTIPTIAMERIRRAAKKIKEETGADIDYGFKHYTLVDKGNTLDKLEKFDENSLNINYDIMDKFESKSLLITFAVDDGFGLNPHIEEIDLEGYIAYRVENKEWTEEVVLYLLDKGFEDKHYQNLIKMSNERCLNISKVIVFGYAFGMRELQLLSANISQLGIKFNNDNSVNLKPIVRY